MVTKEIFFKNLLLRLTYNFIPFAENIKEYKEVIEEYEHAICPKISCFSITLNHPHEVFNLMNSFREKEKVLYEHVDNIKDWLANGPIISNPTLTKSEYYVNIYFNADPTNANIDLYTLPIKTPIIIKLLRNAFFDDNEMLLKDNQVLNYWG